MRKMSKKNKIVAVAAAAVLTSVGGGVAFAFWTTTGSGNGSAATGSNTSIDVVQTSVVGGLEPAGAAQTLSGNFNNPNSSPVYVTDVVASITSVTQAPDAVGTCGASDFTLANETMLVGAEVGSGDGVGSWSGATLAFNNKADTNQDGCKGATVNLSYASH
ncbi:MAG: hypothetical protein JWQ75_2240 [Pseudarthrobacter sp.]|nr:hypothetical protein [Pseudarthrobacter sp.]